MSVCVLHNLEKYRVLWTDFLASCREINRFAVSKIGPKPAKTDDFSSPGTMFQYGTIFHTCCRSLMNISQCLMSLINI